MKNIFYRISSSLLPVLFFGVLAISCKDDVDNLEPMRMFTPAGNVTIQSLESQVKLTWPQSLHTPAGSNVTYTVEVAEDTLFQTPVILTVETDTAGVVFTDDQLEVRKNYYARIRANALGDRPESKPFVTRRFRIRGEQIFLPIANNELIDNGVILRWMEYPGITHIVVKPAGGEPYNVALTAEDLAARMKVIDNLTPSTSYTVDIYQDTKSKGSLSFRTLASVVVGSVIDLTDILNRPSVLEDTLLQIPSGSTVLLRRGATYTISSTLNIDRSVLITSENSFNPELAKIYFTSNFNVPAGAQIDSVVFKNVYMSSDNYGSRYVFNINNTCTVGKIKFDGVHAEIFRGLVRFQQPVTLNEYSINNSVVDSLANYGIMTIDHADCKVKDIRFNNSTFYKIERGITSKAGANSILISNSTFFAVPESGRYLIDFSSNNITAGVALDKVILGMGKFVMDNNEVRGIRAGSATSVTSTSAFATTDYVATANQIPGLIVYQGTSFDLFRNPKNGDFTLKTPASAAISNAGDPRWRP